MDSSLTVGVLYDEHYEKLSLEWVAGHTGESRPIAIKEVSPNKSVSSGVLVGHLNLIHPHRIQVLGKAELEYLEGLGKNSHADTITQLFSNEPAFIVIADNMPATTELKQVADRTGTPLFQSSLSAYTLINNLQYYISGSTAEKLTMHGVFMEVMGVGMLLTGESRVGKSELALELITRGHRLIADDAPEFMRISPDTINGTCPPALSGFLEVRGLGILNIRAMFGESAIKNDKNLRLIVHLQPLEDESIRKLDRLHGSRQNQKLLDVDIALVKLPVAPGRNLAVLVEAAVRNHILYMTGYNAAQDFIEKQQNLILADGP